MELAKLDIDARDDTIESRRISILQGGGGVGNPKEAPMEGEVRNPSLRLPFPLLVASDKHIVAVPISSSPRLMLAAERNMHIGSS